MYAEVTKKLEQRVTAYMPHKSVYSTAKRVLICNVFFVSLFTYLNRFFVMGEGNSDEVESLISSWVVPDWTPFSHDQLIAPTRSAGLVQPLRDHYKGNIAGILARREEVKQPRRVKPHFDPIKGHSMLISDHIHKATVQYHHFAKASPMEDQTKKALLQALYLADETPRVALVAKLKSSIGEAAAEEVVSTIHRNTRSLPANLPAGLRNHAFLLVHNAVPTHDRLKYAVPGVVNVCAFCGAGPDSLKHMHTRCRVAATAISLISNHTPDQTSLVCLRSPDPDDFLLRTEASPEDTLTRLVFSLVLWPSGTHRLRNPASGGCRSPAYYIPFHQAQARGKQAPQEEGPYQGIQ